METKKKEFPFTYDGTKEILSYLEQLGTSYGTKDLETLYNITPDYLLTCYEDILKAFQDKAKSCLITFDKVLCQIKLIENNLLEIMVSTTLSDFFITPVKGSLLTSEEPMSLSMLTKADMDLLSNYVTNIDGYVYAFKNLPEEVVAVLLSYVSRSPNSFKENLLKLLKDEELNINTTKLDSINYWLSDQLKTDLISTDQFNEISSLLTNLTNQTDSTFTKSSEKAAKFHEKWVLGYGHASCAETAQVKMGIDQISILASKELEDNRLGSYIEKSTRYQQFDSNSYHLPNLPEGLDFAYCDMMDYAFKVYNDMFTPIEAALTSIYPNTANVSNKAYLNSIHAKACDILRYLLPVSTYTSLGFSMNARTLASSISKMKSSFLQEVMQISDEIKKEALKVCPTLLKYAEYNVYRDNLFFDSIQENMGTTYSNGKQPNIVLDAPVTYQDLLCNLFASFVYPTSTYSYKNILDGAKLSSQLFKVSAIRTFMGKRGEFDQVPRFFEKIPLSFDMVLDYGAFRDLQRHRMINIQKQILTPHLGYQAHPDLELLPEDLQQQYHNVFYFNKLFYQNLIDGGVDLLTAQYCLLMGWNIRTNFDMDLREAITLIELRSKEQGHISYRLVAQSMYVLLSDKYPVLKDIIRCDMTNSKTLERLKSELKYNK